MARVISPPAEAADPQALLTSLIEPALSDFDSIAAIKSDVQHLAHYTTVEVLEAFLKKPEIWFSNPLFMNDWQELTWGVQLGFEMLNRLEILKKAFTRKTDVEMVSFHLMRYFEDFFRRSSPDTYVFCFSKHTISQKDGELSMWRAYGQGGHGAALIFNTAFLEERNDSPLLMARVVYGSVEQRQERLCKMFQKWITAAASYSIVKQVEDDETASAIAQSLFASIKVLALTMKHNGFSEEKEWRLIYQPEADPKEALKRYFGYSIAASGVEPKLKLPIEPIDLEPKAAWSLQDVLAGLILGPGMNQVLHGNAVRKMLDDTKKEFLKERLSFSEIPLRLPNSRRYGWGNG